MLSIQESLSRFHERFATRLVLTVEGQNMLLFESDELAADGKGKHLRRTDVIQFGDEGFLCLAPRRSRRARLMRQRRP